MHEGGPGVGRRTSSNWANVSISSGKKRRGRNEAPKNSLYSKLKPAQSETNLPANIAAANCNRRNSVDDYIVRCGGDVIDVKERSRFTVDQPYAHAFNSCKDHKTRGRYSCKSFRVLYGLCGPVLTSFSPAEDRLFV